jgi:quercetin dioxygenase-like cupin family protein
MEIMEPILWNGCPLAYVIHESTKVEKTVFPTPPNLELQVGFVVYPAGGVIASHRHASITRTIDRTCEVLVVKKGRCEVDIFNDDQQLVATRELRTGDLILLVKGGHGIRIQEDTVLLEIKQGPYLGLSEKEFLQ